MISPLDAPGKIGRFHHYGMSHSHLKTVREAVADAARVLAEAGVASPRVDAEWLAAHVLAVPRGRLATAGGFDGAELRRYRELVARRARREPLQHLVGTAPFRHLELAVGPGVFIPRPETEELVSWALSAPELPSAPVVVDFCAGTGAIALSVAHELPGAHVYAVERDPDALAWLHRNAAARTAAGDPPITVVAGDVTDPATTSTLDGRVDVLLCNPPYVPEGTPVPPEVSDHDPGVAVFAGPDGLAVIRPVVARAVALLRPGGVLAIEHDDTHERAVPDLLRGSGAFDAVADHRDMAGCPRFATARRVWQTFTT
jgi:release factor glutamine methyltransferase